MNEGEEEHVVEDRDSFGWSADSIPQWKMEMENTLMLILVLKECLMVKIQYKCFIGCTFQTRWQNVLPQKNT